MKTDFIPRANADWDTWLQNFDDNVTTVATALLIPGADTTAIRASITSARQKYNQSENAKADARNKNNLFRTSRTTTDQSLRAYVRRLKAQPGYTEAQGELLNIEGPETALDPTTAKPVLKGVFENNTAALKFNQFALADGVVIESMRAAETGFTFLSIDTDSPYVDTRAKLDPSKPETRKYRAIYFDGAVTDTIGSYSDEITITIP